MAALESEEAIIQEFLAPLAAGYRGAFGLADDCAVLACPPGEEIVVKTDPVIAGVHFLADTPPADIAWKALAVNVSDLAAKGAAPFAYVMTLALPAAPSRRWMTAFAAGLAEAQAAFGCHLVGGDTDRTPGLLTVGITAFGRVPADSMVPRGGAQPGDRLCVSGTLGDAALGLELLLRTAMASPGLRPQGARAEGAPLLTAAEADYLIARQRRPQPRLALAPALLRHARAAMDISDGLAKDLGRLCQASGAGARVEALRLPLSAPAQRLLAAQPSRIEAVAAGGEDYEILAAVPAAAAAAFLADALSAGVPVADIGEVTAGARVEILCTDGKPLALARPGWDHF